VERDDKAIVICLGPYAASVDHRHVQMLTCRGGQAPRYLNSYLIS
jgi:hypothetical protein